ncbi:hypothetical protein SAMN02799631_05823 [Methylobacterium sp. 174MFSha1.1]|nr:hypothetical protein SAMN02799631_05823 [Methylobacterium sp. 174MFSha1.1]
MPGGLQHTTCRLRPQASETLRVVPGPRCGARDRDPPGFQDKAESRSPCLVPSAVVDPGSAPEARPGMTPRGGSARAEAQGPPFSDTPPRFPGSPRPSGSPHPRVRRPHGQRPSTRPRSRA